MDFLPPHYGNPFTKNIKALQAKMVAAKAAAAAQGQQPVATSDIMAPPALIPPPTSIPMSVKLIIGGVSLVGLFLIYKKFKK